MAGSELAYQHGEFLIRDAGVAYRKYLAEIAGHETELR
jgi:hypothetical protein